MPKTFAITGANSGIGLSIAKQLLAQGHTVIALCRDNENNRKVIENLATNAKQFGLGKIDFVAINLNNLHAVRQAAHHVINFYPTIDGLICNAGVMAPPFYTTHQKFEQQFQVNYLSQFLLTHLLIPSLQASSKPRVIFTTSMLAQYGKIDHIEKLKSIAYIKESAYDSTLSYKESKLAQLAMNKYLPTVYPNIKFAAVHPGIVYTNLFYRRIGEIGKVLSLPLVAIAFMFRLMRTAKKGAETIVYLATEDDFETGLYWKDKRMVMPNAIVNQSGYLQDLYMQSMKWVGLKSN